MMAAMITPKEGFLSGELEITDSFSLPYWSIIAIAAALVAVIVVLAVVLTKKKKAKAVKTERADEVVSAVAEESTAEVTVGEPVFVATESVAPVEASAVREQVAVRKVQGSMEIRNCNLGGFVYQLRANNGQLLYESRSYKTTDACKEGIQNFVEAVKAGMFAVRADKFQRYKFILKSPTSSNIAYVGESFSTEAACQSNIQSVQRFVDAPVEDCTDPKFTVHFTVYEIPAKVKSAVESQAGPVGRWEIVKADEKKKNSPFVFLLYASNGQLLFESRDYKTSVSCKNGIETFRKTVAEGQFIIDSDKSGHYKFILRNVFTSSLMEYVGQFYSTQKACAEGIDSIYRFALLSPIDTL